MESAATFNDVLLPLQLAAMTERQEQAFARQEERQEQLQQALKQQDTNMARIVQALSTVSKELQDLRRVVSGHSRGGASEQIH